MPAHLLGLDGRQAIVTGAGRGLGRAHAIALAERGARVVVNDIARDEDGSLAEKVVAEIRALGGSGVAHTRSISDPDTATTLVALCRDTFGPVDIVVNNAGISGSDGVAGTTDDALGSHLAVHVAGAFSLIRAAWNDLGARGDGRIVNTTSGVGLLGYRRAIGYAAAKSALVGLTRTLAIDGAPHGIKVNSIAPIARTAMAGDTFTDLTDCLDPELVSALAVFLAHPRCEVSGEVFSAGGGRIARWMIGVTQGIYDPRMSPEVVAERLPEVFDDQVVLPLSDALAETQLIRRARA